MSDRETLDAAYAAFGRGDLDALFALSAEDVEWVPPSYAPEPGPHVGREAIERGIGAYYEDFDEFKPRPERVLETETPGRYLVMVETFTRGKGSGAEVTINVAHLVDVREGKLRRLQVFTDRAAAFEAAGLDPEP